MSKISEMRENPTNQINLVKVIERIFPDRKTKYIELFARLIREHYQNLSIDGDFLECVVAYNMDGLNPLEQLFLLEIIQNILEGEEISRWKYFCNKYESNAIKSGIDLQTISYNDLDEIIDEQYKIDEQKELEKQIFKLIDNEEWLVLVPLTYESSKKYGANTKWCTTNDDSDDAFKQYVRDGMLIYIINKKNNVKHAIFYEIRDQTNSYSNLIVYDAEDDCVELIFLDIPHTILTGIREFLKDYPITAQDLSEKVSLKNKQNETIEKYFDIERNRSSDLIPSGILPWDGSNLVEKVFKNNDFTFFDRAKPAVEKYLNYEEDTDNPF